MTDPASHNVSQPACRTADDRRRYVACFPILRAILETGLRQKRTSPGTVRHRGWQVDTGLTLVCAHRAVSPGIAITDAAPGRATASKRYIGTGMEPNAFTAGLPTSRLGGGVRLESRQCPPLKTVLPGHPQSYRADAGGQPSVDSASRVAYDACMPRSAAAVAKDIGVVKSTLTRAAIKHRIGKRVPDLSGRLVWSFTARDVERLRAVTGIRGK